MDSSTKNSQGEKYWKKTLALLLKVLSVWFLVSFGGGILFAQALNGIHLGGLPFGILVCKPRIHFCIHNFNLFLCQSNW